MTAADGSSLFSKLASGLLGSSLPSANLCVLRCCLRLRIFHQRSGSRCVGPNGEIGDEGAAESVEVHSPAAEIHVLEETRPDAPAASRDLAASAGCLCAKRHFSQVTMGLVGLEPTRRVTSSGF